MRLSDGWSGGFFGAEESSVILLLSRGVERILNLVPVSRAASITAFAFRWYFTFL
jgi:hypothetical protein